jgi:hypothetical protein
MFSNLSYFTAINPEPEYPLTYLMTDNLGFNSGLGLVHPIEAVGQHLGAWTLNTDGKMVLLLAAMRPPEASISSTRASLRAEKTISLPKRWPGST